MSSRTPSQPRSTPVTGPRPAPRPTPRAPRTRRVLALLRWTSALLIAFIVAIFALSFVRYDVIEHNRGTLIRPTATDPYFHHILHSISIFNGRGALVVSWWNYESVGPTEESMRAWKDMLGFRHEHSRPGPMGFRTWFEFEDWRHWRFAGLGIESFTRGGTTGHAVLIPHWLPLVLATSPWLYAWFTFRSRRRRAGLCAKCGYDRQGLEAPTPCPECGTTAPSPRATPQ